MRRNWTFMLRPLMISVGMMITYCLLEIHHHWRKMKILVMTRKCSDPIFKHQKLGISAKDMTWHTLPLGILAEANEIQDVKEAIQALMIREEEDAANSPTI